MQTPHMKEAHEELGISNERYEKEIFPFIHDIINGETDYSLPELLKKVNEFTDKETERQLILFTIGALI